MRMHTTGNIKRNLINKIQHPFRIHVDVGDEITLYLGA